MPSIRDVAKRLNLSITTVSRALDGYSDVAEETRQLVIKTAQKMGYVPNRAARQLRRQRSDTIGYILPARAPQFADPFSLSLSLGWVMRLLPTILTCSFPRPHPIQIQNGKTMNVGCMAGKWMGWCSTE